MGLLPALFQNTDPMPMALGRKIEAPVEKKPDPIAAFERGDHRVVSHPPLDAPYVQSARRKYGGALVDSIKQAWRAENLTFVQAWDTAFDESTPIPTAVYANIEAKVQHRDRLVSRAKEAVKAAHAEGVAMVRIRELLHSFDVTNVMQLTTEALPAVTQGINDIRAARKAVQPTLIRDRLMKEAEDAVRQAVGRGVSSPELDGVCEQITGTTCIRDIRTGDMITYINKVRDLGAVKVSPTGRISSGVSAALMACKTDPSLLAKIMNQTPADVKDFDLVKQELRAMARDSVRGAFKDMLL